MKIKYTVFLLFLSLITQLKAQNSLNNFGDSVQVGIVEHLGETIPLEVTFQNEKDSTVHLRDLVTKPTVFTFVYFDCPGICSPLLDGVSEVIQRSDLELGKDYQVITISFNYNDSPEKAAIKKQNFIKKHIKGNYSSWIYLTGDSANIYKIVNAVGFKFKRQGLDYIHAAAIMIVSPKGKITRYLYGLTFLPIDLKMAVYESEKGLARPGRAKALEFCYAYDPVGRRYVLDVLKISASLIILVLVLFFSTLFIKSKLKSKMLIKNE